MGRFLCWLGFHDWRYGIVLVTMPESVEVLMVRSCHRSTCDVVVAVPNDKTDWSRAEVTMPHE